MTIKAGLHRNRSVSRPTPCRKCGLSIAYEEKYVHTGAGNYHVKCYVDGRGVPIYTVVETAEAQTVEEG